MSQILLAELLTPDRIRIPIHARDKRGVIEELSAFMAERAGLPPEEARRIGEAVLEREAVLTTGIGGGVAIPHGKVEAFDDLVMVAGLTGEPVEFEALDGQPVRIVLLLVGPESASGKHVRTLSRIGRLLRSEGTRRRLAGARTAEEFHRALVEAEGPNGSGGHD